MRIDQLKYVSVIEKYHSISRAAEELFITQPSLSRAVTALEKELGVQIFQRNSQGVSLTPIGEKIMPHFENIITEMNSVKNLTIEEQGKNYIGELVVSASSLLCNNLLSDVMFEFKTQYPSIAIDIVEEYATDIVNSVYNQKVDIGFLSISPDMEAEMFSLLEERQCKYRLLSQNAMVVLLSADSPFANCKHISQEQLVGFPLILDRKTKPFVITKDIPDNISVVYCQDRDARTKMILQNQGYSVVSSLEVYDDYYIRQKLMVAIPADWCYMIGLWLIHKTSLNIYERDFVTILESMLNEKDS